MKAVLLSTYKEEYLLKWWLPHHAEKFDVGIIADFDYTYEEGKYDEAIELYKKYVPHWQVIKITHPEVSNAQWDMILSSIETKFFEQYKGSTMMCLNPTEFLIGDTSILDNMPEKSRMLVGCHLMTDKVSDEWIEPDPNIPLLKQRTHGIHYKNDFPHPHKGKTHEEFMKRKEEFDKKGIVHNVRWMRSAHNYPRNYFAESVYSVGRHFWNLEDWDDRLAICHMNLSPYTEKFIERKMNVQTRLTQEDHVNNRGIHHRTNKEKIADTKKFYDALAIDLSDEINRMEKL